MDCFFKNLFHASNMWSWLLLLRHLTTCLGLKMRGLEVQVTIITPMAFMCKKGNLVYQTKNFAIGLKYVGFESTMLLSSVEPNSTFL